MHKNWLNYYRTSLLDAQRMQVDFEKGNHKVIKNLNVSNGAIPFEVMEAIIEIEEIEYNRIKRVTDPTDPDWFRLESVNVLISPFSIAPIPKNLGYDRTSSTSHPFWFSASLNREGMLTVPEITFPIIPRPFLLPSAGKSADFIFSDVEKVDFASAISTEDLETWKDYWAYLNEVFEEVTDETLDTYKLDGYRVNDETIIYVPDNERGAASSIINLYQHFNNDIPELLKNIVVPKKGTVKNPMDVSDYMDHLSQHLGQMSDSFPLSISQRKTMNTFLISETHSVFAVNGPPGTGKTTLLQSVVANEMVGSAIAGKHPPTILACSSNNQAVKNINESFSRTESTLTTLSGRWLPDFEGYASYLPASSKTPEDLFNINYFKLDGSGTFQLLENEDYVDNAENFFIKKILTYTSKHFINIQQCADALQNELIDIKSNLGKLQERWKTYTKAHAIFEKHYNSVLPKEDYLLIGWVIDKIKIEADLSWFKQAERLIQEYYDNEPFFRKLGCFFRVKRSLGLRKIEIEKIFRTSPVSFAERKINSKLETLSFCNQQVKTLSLIDREIDIWNQIKNSLAIKGNPVFTEEDLWKHEWNKIQNKDATPSYLYDELDISVRHKAFQLAVHYWEARWLLEVRTYLNDERRDKKGYQTTINRIRLRSMLTPCYVSTFYMAPKFFSYWSFDDESESWANPPITSLVDLLMVDEAGQTTPEVGTAVFGLAKKAIVVGDVKQIEPIWNIPSKIDISNLCKNKLLTSNETESFEALRKLGNLASNGSLMKMAQNASDYIELNVNEKGLLLREHRRCYNEIIEYCNQLAYDGQLIPMKGKKEKNSYFPAMAIVHIEGNSTVRNKDRFNTTEAIAVADYLIANKSRIENMNGKTVEEEVGVITPFVGQKRELKNAMRTKGFNINQMKIGTVHALQGAERSIIIFSSVYGEGDVGTMFFDRDNKPNMLNVAVSRAKESFMVFGNTKIFNSNTNTPSGKLAAYLKV